MIPSEWHFVHSRSSGLTILSAIAAVGAGFSRITPRRRPFDITDRSISYPLNQDTVSDANLLLVTLIAPAFIISVGSLFMNTVRSPSRALSRASIRRKLWEMHTGWLGLALAYAITFAVVNGTKEVVGKPRPNFLARCSPDISRRIDFSGRWHR